VPELPDVEVFKQYLDSTSLHQEIESVEVRNEEILGDVSARELERGLEGRRFESTRRHGKNLFVELDVGGWLLMHFGMTGTLKCFKDVVEDPPHDRLLITFKNGHHLTFEDQRMLGRVELIEDPENLIEAEKLGPDALTLDFSSFLERLEGRKAAVKPALMNQRVLSGIGNIYSDEVLFQARLHPKTNVEKLDETALKNLFEEMKRVLQTAIECGADSGRFPDEFLLPRRHEGEECPKGNGEIEKIKVSGRSAYYCAACQPDGRED
jgi:formamidopyrimidine-DNA glycosylase